MTFISGPSLAFQETRPEARVSTIWKCNAVLAGRTAVQHRGRPNPYEDPRCQETNAPSERMFQRFFRRIGPDVVLLGQRVLT